MKVQEHSIINFNQIFNNKYKGIENQEKFQDLDFEKINVKFNQNNKNKYYSPLMAYYNINNQYLIKKYIENYNEINIEKSNNYIRKDSFNQNIQNQVPLNGISLNKNKLTNGYIQIGKNEIYNQNIFFQGNNINQNNITNNFFNNLNNINTLEKSSFNSMNMINNNVLTMLNTNNKNNNNSNMNENNNHNDQYNIEMFGKKGWICVYCSNFNYEGRNKCNRCKKNKSPKNIYNQNLNIEIIKKNNLSNILNNNKQKQFSERLGDWICFNCKNLNFSFRKFCNRCQLSKEESNNYFIQFILYNNKSVLIQNNNITTNNNIINQKM